MQGNKAKTIISNLREAQKRIKMRQQFKMEQNIHHTKTQIYNLSSYILCLFFTFFTCSRAQVYIYAGCSQDKFQPNTPYEINLNSLISSIVSSSSGTLYGSFVLGNDSSAQPDSAVYGLYQCRGDLRQRDCSTCIASLINQIELACPYAYGASLQLDRCYVRYQNTNFFGNADTTLMSRRCSNSATNDVEVLRRKDEVLGELQQATGFRISATGPVEGYAQCLGDLGLSDCSACLSEAVTQVRNLCGSAAAGDVYLAQCYIRYWVAGHYDVHSDSPSHDDEVGKDVAIIVGVIAGIAVVIVLLSLCKQSVSGKK